MSPLQLHKKGSYLDVLDKADEALRDYADSLYPILIEKASSGRDYSAFDPALAYRNYGQYLMKQDNGVAAKIMLQLAFGLYRDSLGELNAQAGQTALYLGQCFQLLNQHDSAGYYLDEAVRILDPEPDWFVRFTIRLLNSM